MKRSLFSLCLALVALVPLSAMAQTSQSPDAKPRDGMLGAIDRTRPVAAQANAREAENKKLLTETEAAPKADFAFSSLSRAQATSSFEGKWISLKGKVVNTGTKDGQTWATLSTNSKNSTVTISWEGKAPSWKKGQEVSVVAQFESVRHEGAKGNRSFQFTVPLPTPQGDPMQGWTLRGYVKEGDGVTAVFTHGEKGKKYVRNGQLLEPGLRFLGVADLQARMAVGGKKLWLTPW